jgi:hypothetical protein
MKVKIFLSLFISFTSCFVWSQDILNFNFREMSSQDIEKIDYKNVKIADYPSLLKKADDLIKDTLRIQKNKGELILAITSDILKNRIDNGIINPKESEIRELLKTYESHKYFLYQPKINDFIKLMHYTCQGKYTYIYSRFSSSSFFAPVILFSLAIVIFTLLNLLGYIKWKYLKFYNKLIIFSFFLTIVLVIVFKLTCHECVQEYSFYGIPF